MVQACILACRMSPVPPCCAACCSYKQLMEKEQLEVQNACAWPAWQSHMQAQVRPLHLISGFAKLSCLQLWLAYCCFVPLLVLWG